MIEAMDKLETIFRANEPEIVLESVRSDGSEVRLLLRDCDGYRLGVLVFSDVQVLCVTTQWETFDSFSCHGKENVPDSFGWLENGIAVGYRLFCFIRPEDEAEESVLPVVGGVRQAFVIAKNVEFVAASQGR